MQLSSTVSYLGMATLYPCGCTEEIRGIMWVRMDPTSNTLNHIIPLLTNSKLLNAANVYNNTVLFNYQGSIKTLLLLPRREQLS